MQEYDSKIDTLDHIATVRDRLGEVIDDLTSRALVHDRSKLEPPEKETFDRVTPQLRALEYGTPEYHAAREAMGGALEHHYANNDHHPEHFSCGVAGMNLMQVIEMLADWKAATLRHDPPGDLRKSISLNQERFGYSDDFRRLLMNTAADLGWL